MCDYTFHFVTHRFVVLLSIGSIYIVTWIQEMYMYINRSLKKIYTVSDRLNSSIQVLCMFYLSTGKAYILYMHVGIYMYHVHFFTLSIYNVNVI